MFLHIIQDVIVAPLRLNVIAAFNYFVSYLLYGTSGFSCKDGNSISTLRIYSKYLVHRWQYVSEEKSGPLVESREFRTG